MREIKFRAWDAKGENMIMNPLGFPELYPINQLMQYTGLRDKNGVEIYEGDILEDTIPDWLYDGSVPQTSSYVVFWDKTSASFQLQEICRVGLGLSGDMCEDDQDVRVIGNAHQNPELLK